MLATGLSPDKVLEATTAMFALSSYSKSVWAEGCGGVSEIVGLNKGSRKKKLTFLADISVKGEGGGVAKPLSAEEM